MVPPFLPLLGVDAKWARMAVIVFSSGMASFLCLGFYRCRAGLGVPVILHLCDATLAHWLSPSLGITSLHRYPGTGVAFVFPATTLRRGCALLVLWDLIT